MDNWPPPTDARVDARVLGKEIIIPADYIDEGVKVSCPVGVVVAVQLSRRIESGYSIFMMDGNRRVMFNMDSETFKHIVVLDVWEEEEEETD